jgi:hypothetical protein
MKTWLAVVSFLCGFACLTGHNAAFARGGGGCFEQGTPVLTPQGDIAIEQLRVGDMVSGGGKVVAAYQVQPVEYLEIPGGIHVTPEHPFQTAPGIFQTAERVSAIAAFTVSATVCWPLTATARSLKPQCAASSPARWMNI